jgi:hypothetical protein
LDFTFYLKVAFGYRNGSFHSTPHWSPDYPERQNITKDKFPRAEAMHYYPWEISSFIW